LELIKKVNVQIQIIIKIFKKSGNEKNGCACVIIDDICW